MILCLNYKIEITSETYEAVSVFLLSISNFSLKHVFRVEIQILLNYEQIFSLVVFLFSDLWCVQSTNL